MNSVQLVVTWCLEQWDLEVECLRIRWRWQFSVLRQVVWVAVLCMSWVEVLNWIWWIASRGVTCMIPYRGEGDEVRHLKQSGDIGKVNPIPFHPRDEQSIRDCIGNADIVLNLVGTTRQRICIWRRTIREWRRMEWEVDIRMWTSTSLSVLLVFVMRWVWRIYCMYLLYNRIWSIGQNGPEQRWE